MRVLLVDDHTHIRHMLGELLREQTDMELVGEARNGREAVALARELKPDLILMDIRMPFLDGIKATEAILAERPTACVIGMSLFGDAREVEGMLAAGAKVCLSKSRILDVLLPTMRQWFPQDDSAPRHGQE